MFRMNSGRHALSPSTLISLSRFAPSKICWSVSDKNEVTILPARLTSFSEMNPEYDALYKILLLGDDDVGKTKFILRFCDEQTWGPLGVNFKIRTIELEDKTIKLQIWDTAGQERFRTITTSYYRGAEGLILMYDITNENSFHNIKQWLQEIERYASPDIERMLVGNNADMEDRRVVPKERGEQLAINLGIPFFETSIKTKANIDETFETLTRMMLKKNPPGSDTLTETAAREKGQLLLTEFEKGMKEGYVLLTNKKIVLFGPPCVGKTSFKSLLFNWPAPKQHNSTAIASRPVQAIERIAERTEGKIWDVVKTDDLFQMLSDAIHNTGKMEKVHNTSSSSSPTVTPPSLPLDGPTTSIAVPVPTASSTTVTVLVKTPRSATSGPARDADYYSRDILQYLAYSNENKRSGSQELHKATWIHLLDSGGQPQFADMLRMFMRGNSLYVIVMKVTEALQDKPTFAYSLDGKILNTPKELQMTNLEMIENFVRSVAASRNAVIKIGDKEITTKPAFAVVASHCDQSKFKRLVGLDESLKEKNAELLSCLSEFLDLFIFYNSFSNELIFPVDNLCWWNRKKISAEIRHRMTSCENIGFSVPIPIRWYMFDMKLKEKVSKESHGMLSLDSCYAVGEKLEMARSDVDQCLVFLDSLSMCIYYPILLPNTIFTNIQYLLDTLSNIVRVSFVDKLEAILPKGVSLSPDTQELLKRDGIFDESLLDNLGLTFVPSIFTKSDLLQLLQHLCVIAPINTPGPLCRYFMPIVLPTNRLTSEQKQVFTTSVDPLLVTFNSKLVLRGLFPTLIVSLLSRKEEPRFTIDSRTTNFPNQLRYAAKLYSENLFGSVFVCDNYKSIEVFFTGRPKHCYLLRQVILQALSASANILAYDLEALEFSALVYCTRKHMLPVNDEKPHPITISFKESPPVIGCSVEDLPIIELTDERQSCWLIEPESSVLPLSNVLPDGILNEAHAPVILTAISDLVDEWETLGIILGLKNSVIEEIKYNSFFQVQICRKEMIIRWLQGGTATRQSLITALMTLQRGDIIAKIQALPTH